ncbi:MAG: LysR family transcriptional regulator [Intrasporangium sp.]|uniref:LysR family transcriptional regulator n=1 Tax=Intrasporangium sp. TaxID=1925024 RepID=UPI002649271E|nr:LysR family transcriptional regulator [Intrasporangium sp.]MDN5796410.1 LysR family transcriptional regulator [Intrasporangium sp.]
MDLRNADLNLLVAFDMLVTERSVTRAAGRMSVGQPAMSAILGRLRKLFGDPLFVREGRGLVATPLAESLAQPVRDLLTHAEAVLSRGSIFDPTTAQRTFSVIANDYLTMTFLHPLLARLAVEAPGIRLHIFPTGDDFADQLRRNLVDLLIVPLEAMEGVHAEFPHHVLFRDRYLVALDQNHPDVGDTITLEQFSTLPYLATSSGHLRSLSEMQLDFLGVPRNVEITTAFGVAPFLLKGTRLITLIHERLAYRVADEAGLKVLEPPIPRLQPITEIMLWTKRTDGDTAHQWLRQRLLHLASELDSA